MYFYLFMLSDQSVNEVWNFETLLNDSHFSDVKTTTEFIQEYSTYMILPTDAQRFPDEEKNMIIVNVSSERILVDAQENKVILRTKETSQLCYVWNDVQFKFVKQE